MDEHAANRCELVSALACVGQGRERPRSVIQCVYHLIARVLGLSRVHTPSPERGKDIHA